MLKEISDLYTNYSKSQLKLPQFINCYVNKKIHQGYCPICEKNVYFIKREDWLRDYYFCLECRSIPRQRAMANALNLYYPDWRNLEIHESSPAGPCSDYIRANCSGYTQSHFFPDVAPGELKYNIRCENLEQLTFADNSFDIIITQDVFEHILNPDKGFKEINRVLKAGGAHIFTIPWYPQIKETVQRAKFVDNEIKYLEEPVYHGNPIDAKGSLVTFDWGIDMPDYIYKHSGMFTTVHLAKDPKMGLEAEFLEVFVSRKN
jgi:SAM-dependent methyltransferase